VIEKILNFFNLKPGEGILVFSLWLLLAINMMVMELSDVVATAGFVNALGVEQIPWLWLVTTILTLIAAGGYSVLVDRSSRLSLVSWLLFFLAAFYLGLRFLFQLGAPEWFSYPGLSIISDQQYYIIPLAFWALANDTFALTDGKRIFPILASGAVVGGIAGNSLAGMSARILEQLSAQPSEIFLLASILLLFGLVILRLTYFGRSIRARQSKDENSGLKDSFKVGVDYFGSIPMLKMVAVFMTLSGIALAMLEFHFLRLIEGSTNTTLEFQQFLGYYKTAQTIGLLLFQWLVAGRLLGRVSLKSVLIFLPITLVGSLGIAIAVMGLMGAGAGRFFARLIQRGWDEPARKTLQGLIPDERRGRVAVFMDTTFYNSATILSALILGLLAYLWKRSILTEEIYHNVYLGIGILAAIGAVWASFNMRRVYETSLLDWRFSRSKRKSVLDNIEF
jgi:hypothetical protein